MSGPTTILGVELTENNFPEICKWAKVNPEGLERTIKKMMEKDGSAVAVCFSTLESSFKNIDFPTVCKFDKPIDEERRRMLSRFLP